MEPELLEDLIKRYEAGERDPELIQSLNEAAWNGFHDPWEPAPRDPNDLDAPDASDASAEDEDGDEDEDEDPDQGDPMDMDPEMLTVRPFTLETIERHLQARDLSYWKTDAPMCLVFMGYDQPSDRSMEAMHCVEGRNGSIYSLHIVGDRRVDADDYGRARELCDRWNARFRWPRAYLDIPAKADGGEGETPGSGLLTLDYQLMLEKGIHQALFDDLVSGAVGASFDFWKLAKDEFNL